jgi:hypothetical protein
VNRALFELQCQFGETDIKKGRGIVSMVLTRPEPAGEIVPEAKATSDTFGTVVRVASPDGGFTTAAIAYGISAKELEAGDLVICVPVAFREHIASELKNERLGWLWELRAQIDPKSDPADGFKILRRFEPPTSTQAA